MLENSSENTGDVSRASQCSESIIRTISGVNSGNRLKDDRAFGLLHQEIPQILYHASLTTFCITYCQNFEEKIGVDGKIWEKGGLISFKGSSKEKCQF